MHSEEDKTLTDVLFENRTPPRYWPYRHLVFPYLVSFSSLLVIYMLRTISTAAWTSWASVLYLFVFVTWLTLELIGRWRLVDAELVLMPPGSPRQRKGWKWWTYDDPTNSPLYERVTAPIVGTISLLLIVPFLILMVISEGGVSEIPVPMWLFIAIFLYYMLFIITPRHAPKVLKCGAKIGLFFMDFFKHLRKLLEILADDSFYKQDGRHDS